MCVSTAKFPLPITDDKMISAVLNPTPGIFSNLSLAISVGKRERLFRFPPYSSRIILATPLILGAFML